MLYHTQVAVAAKLCRELFFNAVRTNIAAQSFAACVIVKCILLQGWCSRGVTGGLGVLFIESTWSRRAQRGLVEESLLKATLTSFPPLILLAVESVPPGWPVRLGSTLLYRRHTYVQHGCSRHRHGMATTTLSVRLRLHAMACCLWLCQLLSEVVNKHAARGGSVRRAVERLIRS